MTSIGYRSDHGCRAGCEQKMQFYRAGERNFARARAPPPGLDGVEEPAAAPSQSRANAKRGGKGERLGGRVS